VAITVSLPLPQQTPGVPGLRRFGDRCQEPDFTAPAKTMPEDSQLVILSRGRWVALAWPPALVSNPLCSYFLLEGGAW
jgi:hypothetical protein